MRFDQIARGLAAVAATLMLAACGGGGGPAVAAADGTKFIEARKGGGGGGGGGGGSGAAPALAADAGVHSMTLTWSDDGTTQYNAYVSSSPNCDVANYSLCPDGRMLVGVRSPHKVGGLVNGRVYYAKIETVGKKSASLSNEAGARPTTLEFNGAVWAIAPAADGTTYLGGDFTRIGLTSGHGVLVDAVSGRPSVPGFPVFDGSISAAAPDGAGGWYVGGDFGRVGAVARPHLVHVRADGSVDTAWNPVPDASVWSIAVMNGVVYIGGRFSTVNGQQRKGLAAIDAASGQLMAWNPNPNFSAWTIAAANGTIYIGGTFTSVGAFRRNYLAAIDTFGNVLPWDPSADGTVTTLAVSGSTVFAGGFFDNVSGQPRGKLAAIDATTGTPKAWNASLGCAGCEVRAIAISGSTVYVGGRFPQIGGVARRHLAAVDAASGSVLPWNPSPEYSVWSLAVIKDPSRGTTVYAGGEFTAIGGQPRAYLAALDAQGSALPWNPAPTAHVQTVVAAGSQLFVGGHFTGTGATVRSGLAAVDASGALKSWNPGAYGTVRALAVAGDAIYAGGNFTSVGGQPRKYLARLDAAGNVSGWNPAPDQPVLALALGAERTLYAGGEFRYVAGTPRNRLAAFAPNGTLLGWAPNADHEVHALAVGPYFVTGETVYVGGLFSGINGQVRRRIAQVDALGAPTSWNPSGSSTVEPHVTVRALRYADGVIYAGGLFAHLGRHLAQISESGTILRSPGTDWQVWTLALSGRTLIFGGDFTRVLDFGANPYRNRIAAIDVDTGAVSAWSPDVGNGTVYALARDGASIHAGGSFTLVDGQVVSGFATLAP